MCLRLCVDNCPKLYVTGQNLINLRFAYFGMYLQIYYFMYKIVDIFLYLYRLDIIAETRRAVT